MNEFPNNRSGLPTKQINRVVTPIQLDQNGNRIEVSPTGVSETVNTSIRQDGNPNGISNLPLEKTKKEHDPTNTVFVIILLIILACVCAFTFYVIVPRYLAKENRLQYNDGTTTKYATIDISNTYKFKSARINEGVKVITTGTFPVDNDFQIETIASESGLNLSINGHQVTTTKSIGPTIGRIDDLIIMLLNDGNARQNRVVAYDKLGNNILEIKNIEGVGGMLPLGDVSSLVINSNSFVILASRALGNTLILSNTYGEVTGTSVCDKDALTNLGVTDEYMVVGVFAIQYKRHHEFSSPQNITHINLREYKTSNRYCQ